MIGTGRKGAAVRWLAVFGRDRRGVTALTFAVSAMVLLAAVFAAIDAARFSAAKVELQDALDAAVLAAAATNSDDQATITRVGSSYMAAQLANNGDMQNMKVTFTLTDKTMTGVATAEVDPIFMDLFTNSLVHLGASSEVQRGKDQTLELALVLDTTGSMAGNKISTLKQAAKSLVTKLSTGAPAGAVKVGVVPFATYVNMGVASRNQAWANVPADQGSSKFKGCYGSPPYPQNVRDSDSGRRYPGFLNLTCSKQVTPLTGSASTVTSAIDALSASGNTYIPAGLAWGFNMLSPQAPITDAAAYDTTGPNRKPRKALLLMTDGANTALMRVNGDHEGTPSYGARAVQTDTYTSELCANIKAQKIEIYAVAFDIGSDTVARNLVKSCATDSTHFYDAANSADLIAAFDAIAASLQALRISK